jgi:hypothetical protein
MKHILRLFFVIFIPVLVTVLPSTAFAEGSSLSVSPMVSDMTVAPGTTQTGLITLRFNSMEGAPPVDLKVSIKDWTIDTAGKPIFTEVAAKRDSCANWVQIDPLELSIPAGESKDIRFTVTVPPGAQGSYHCIVFFATAPTPNIYKVDNAQISTVIGNTIYVQVGPVVRRAKVTEMALTNNNVSLTVQNTGSSYFRVNGIVKIADSSGNVVQQVDVPRSVVLPGTDNTRTIDISLPSTLKSGAYTSTAILDYGGDALLGARINATVP